MARWRVPLALLLLVSAASGCQTGAPPSPQTALAPGCATEIWARVPDARGMAASADGATIYVGTGGDTVYAVHDPNLDGRADVVAPLVGGLEAPAAIARAPDGSLLIAERHRIVSLRPGRGIEVVVPAGVLPDAGEQGRVMSVGPDGRLYVGVDARCKACVGRGFRGTIVRLRPDGHDLTIFASGLRAVGGLAWRPGEATLLVADRGGLGVDGQQRAGEVNTARAPGRHFGFPDVRLRAATYRPLPDEHDGSSALPAPPALQFEQDAQPLGLEIYHGTMLPPPFRDTLLVIERRPGRQGLEADSRIMSARFDGDDLQLDAVLAANWTDGTGTHVGHPVDLEPLREGSLLISDRQAGVIWRLACGQA